MSCKGKVEDEEEKEAKQEARDVVVRSCRPRRKRGIIIVGVDVPSAGRAGMLSMMIHHRRRDFLGGVKDNNVFLKCHIGMANFLLENDPKHNKNKKRR